MTTEVSRVFALAIIKSPAASLDMTKRSLDRHETAGYSPGRYANLWFYAVTMGAPLLIRDLSFALARNFRIPWDTVRLQDNKTPTLAELVQALSRGMHGLHGVKVACYISAALLHAGARKRPCPLSCCYTAIFTVVGQAKSP